jgi:hypothetical protein
MATAVRYSAAEKKKLKAFEWNGRGSAMAALRAVKMLAPRCETCQTPEVIKAGNPRQWTWMQDCTHGAGPDGMKPYFALQPKVIKTPKLEQDEDGDFTLVETAVRTKMIRVPNIVEIPLSERFDDGESVIKAEKHGFKHLEDGGLAPMCEMYGCGKAWPGVQTDLGRYCSEDHARLCVADATGVTLTVNDGARRRAELRSVQI